MTAPHEMNRRALLAGLGAGLVLFSLPVRADEALLAEAIELAFGDAPRRDGRIAITLPPLAETGNNVPLTISVEAAMAGPQRPRRVLVFANKNPRALIGEMHWGPGAAKPEFSTNIRLSGTQDVIAIAELGDGSLWQAQVRVLVTVGACDTLSIRY